MPNQTNTKKRAQAVADIPRYQTRKKLRDAERTKQNKEKASYKTDYDINSKQKE